MTTVQEGDAAPTEQSTGGVQSATAPAGTSDVNVAIVASREFLLTEIPLLNDLSQTLEEVISAMPDMEGGRITSYQIGDFELDSINKDETGLRFEDVSATMKNGFQISAKFCDIHVLANKAKFGFKAAEAPMVDVAVDIPLLEIAINFYLKEKNEIRFYLAKDGITLPSIQASAKRRLIKTVGRGVGHILPKLGQGVNLTDKVLHDIINKMNPWFERTFIAALTCAIKEQSSNIVPDGMDKVTIEAGEGTITSSITFKTLLLDDESLWLKAHCQWGAHMEGKPDYEPPSVVHTTRALNKAERFKTDVSAFVDTSLVDEMLEVVWYVTPYAEVLSSQQVNLGTAIVSMLQHLPGWKARKDKLVAHLNHTSEPPKLKASDEHGLYTDIKVVTTLTLDPEANEENGGGEKEESITVFKVQVDATSQIVGPTFDPDKGTFDFDLVGLDINDIVVSDYRDSHMSKWLTRFLDRALVHRTEEEETFSHWWEREGGLIDKCQHGLNAFHEHLMDRLREKVNEAVSEGLKEANDLIDEQISQFVLPTGNFNVIGHNIHLKAQEITADMDDDIIKVMTDIVLDDDKKAEVVFDKK